jgi:hypothetical protein
VAAIVALCVMSSAAVAQAATPPTLVGEAFSAQENVDNGTGAQFPFILGQCGNWNPYSVPSSFDISGQASGPFPGWFEETGSVSYNSSDDSNAWGQGPVLTFTSTFTITGPNGYVTATGSTGLVPSTAELAVCGGSAGGGGVNIGPFLTKYTATITNPDGSTTVDSGQSYVTLSQWVGLGEYWEASLIQSFFATPPPPPPPLTLSDLTATVNGSTVNVSVDTSPAIVNVTLEENGAKVAPDDTPVNGVASWTLTDVPPGAHTLAVQGWDSPSGQPGDHSGVQTFLVVVPQPPSPPRSGGSSSASSSVVVTTSPVVVVVVNLTEIKARLIEDLVPSAAKLAGLLKSGRYTYSLNTPSAGQIMINWYRANKHALVASGHVSFSKAGPVKVTMKLTATGRRMLEANKSLKLIANGTYTPTGRAALVVTKRFTFTR